MKLELNKKWKWAAKDKNGVWFLYVRRPERTQTVWDDMNVIESCVGDDVLSFFPPCNWEDSLHEIKDGELVRPKELKLKRYLLTRCVMEEAPDGDYVRWDDVKDLSKKLQYQTERADANWRALCAARGEDE